MSSEAASLLSDLLRALAQPATAGALNPLVDRAPRAEPEPTLALLTAATATRAAPTSGLLRDVLKMRITPQMAERAGVVPMGAEPAPFNLATPNALILKPSAVPLPFYWVREFQHNLKKQDVYLQIIDAVAMHCTGEAMRTDDGKITLVMYVLELAYKDITSGNTSAAALFLNASFKALKRLHDGNGDAFSFGATREGLTKYESTPFYFFYVDVVLNRGDIHLLNPTRLYVSNASDTVYKMLTYLYENTPQEDHPLVIPMSYAITCISTHVSSYGALKFTLEHAQGDVGTNNRVFNALMKRVREMYRALKGFVGYQLARRSPLLDYVYLLEDGGVLAVAERFRRTMRTISRNPDLRQMLENDDAERSAQVILAIFTKDFRNRYNVHIFLNHIKETLAYMNAVRAAGGQRTLSHNLAALVASYVNDGNDPFFDKTRATLDWQREMFVIAVRAYESLGYRRLPTANELYNVKYMGRSYAHMSIGESDAEEEEEEEEEEEDEGSSGSSMASDNKRKRIAQRFAALIDAEFGTDKK